MLVRIALAALLATLAVALGGRPVPPPGHAPPRVAWLLAFHAAQDAGDVARMLLAAQRLERIGEEALAHHARAVARGAAAEAARRASR